MATLVLGAVGTALGGPIGGAIGALIGRQVDGALFGQPKVRGPRLKELEVTTSSYGTAIPRHHGRMRVPGTIIWSTDLVEHKAGGGGKQGPSIASYSYSVSFAVALSSLPIDGIGRVWADGKLLRGAEGDLKVGGEMRVYTGEADQAVDPLILAAEGAGCASAHRGLAYVVFEDLDLSEYFNRIPALTFEVLAGEAFDLRAEIGELIEGADVAFSVLPISGLTCEGSIAQTLELLAPIAPFAVDAGSDLVTIRPAEGAAVPIALSEAAVAVEDDAFGGAAGHARRRARRETGTAAALRYYDLDRDYLPGIQRATVLEARSAGQTLDFPAAMTATDARALIEHAAHRLDWSRDRIVWRTAEMQPDLCPGSVVTLPDIVGTWRVEAWEWRQSGVELELARRAPQRGDVVPVQSVDPGRTAPQPDAPAPPTTLVALELPWDGKGGPDTIVRMAAVSSANASWKGCALYAEDSTGAMHPLGPSGRIRSIIGTTLAAFPEASPSIFDRGTTLDVELVASDLQLMSASTRQLSQGANLALVGEELVQFSRADPMGDRRWRLSGFMRGRAGTELAIRGHEPDEPFLLLDQTPKRLDVDVIGDGANTAIVALGLGDSEPVSAPLRLPGIAHRPLVPVHGRNEILADGSLRLTWTRRARGAWAWLDGIDTPLHEETERYRVDFGSSDVPVAQWLVDTNTLLLDPARIADLVQRHPEGRFFVRQIGTHGTSHPLALPDLAS